MSRHSDTWRALRYRLRDKLKFNVKPCGCVSNAESGRRLKVCPAHRAPGVGAFPNPAERRALAAMEREA